MFNARFKAQTTELLSQISIVMDTKNSYLDALLISGDIYNYTIFRLGNVTFSELLKLREGRKILIHFWIWPLVFWMTFSIGILGNGMVAYIIIRKKQLWTKTNIYLLNLAIADIMYLLVAIPSTNYWSDYWPCGQIWCKSH